MFRLSNLLFSILALLSMAAGALWLIVVAWKPLLFLAAILWLSDAYADMLERRS